MPEKLLPGLIVSGHGPPGPPGPASSIRLTEALTLPSVAVAPSAMSVNDTSNVRANDWLFIVNGANTAFVQITSVVDAITLDIVNWGNDGNAAPATVFPLGSIALAVGDQRDLTRFDIKRFGALTSDVGPSIVAAGIALQAAGLGSILIPPRFDDVYWQWVTAATFNWNLGTVPGQLELIGDNSVVQVAEGAVGFPLFYSTDSTNSLAFLTRDITYLGTPSMGDDCPRVHLINGLSALYERVNTYGIQARDGRGLFDLNISGLATFRDCTWAGCARIGEGGVISVDGGGGRFVRCRFSPGVLFNGVSYNKGFTVSYVYAVVLSLPLTFEGCSFVDNNFGTAQVWIKIVPGNLANKVTFRDTELYASASVAATGPPMVLVDGPPSAEPMLPGVDFFSCTLIDLGGHREIRQPQPIIEYTAVGELTIQDCFISSSLVQNPANAPLPILFPAKGIIPHDSIGVVSWVNNTFAPGPGPGAYLHPYFVNGAPILSITDSGRTVLYPAHGTSACYDCSEQLAFDVGAEVLGAAATFAPVVAGHHLDLIFTPIGSVSVPFTGAENSEATFLATLNANLSVFASAADSGGQILISLVASLQMYGASGGIVLASSSADVLASLGLALGPFPIAPRVLQMGDQSGNGNLLQGFAASAATLVNPDPAANGRGTLQFRGTDGIATFGAFAAIAQPFVIAWVGRQQVAATAYVSDGAPVANSAPIFGDASEALIHCQFGVAASFPVTDTTQVHVYELQVDGTHTALYVDGTLVGVADAGVNALQGITLGQVGGGGAVAGWDLQFWQVIPGRWGPQERARFESYCSWAFAIELSE